MLRHKGGAPLTFTTFVMGEVLLSQLSESAVPYLEDTLTNLGTRVSALILFESYSLSAPGRVAEFEILGRVFKF